MNRGTTQAAAASKGSTALSKLATAGRVAELGSFGKGCIGGGKGWMPGL